MAAVGHSKEEYQLSEDDEDAFEELNPFSKRRQWLSRPSPSAGGRPAPSPPQARATPPASTGRSTRGRSPFKSGQPIGQPGKEEEAIIISDDDDEVDAGKPFWKRVRPR
jgi:hypothetical protein